MDLDALASARHDDWQRLDALARAYPLRDAVPKLTDSDRQVWMKAGQQQLIEFLQSCFDEANTPQDSDVR